MKNYTIVFVAFQLFLTFVTANIVVCTNAFGIKKDYALKTNLIDLSTRTERKSNYSVVYLLKTMTGKIRKNISLKVSLH